MSDGLMITLDALRPISEAPTDDCAEVLAYDERTGAFRVARYYAMYGSYIDENDKFPNMGRPWFVATHFTPLPNRDHVMTSKTRLESEQMSLEVKLKERNEKMLLNFIGGSRLDEMAQ